LICGRSKLKVKPSSRTFLSDGIGSSWCKLQSSIASFQSKMRQAVHSTGHLEYVRSTNGTPAALVSAINCFLPPPVAEICIRTCLPATANIHRNTEKRAALPASSTSAAHCLGIAQLLHSPNIGAAASTSSYALSFIVRRSPLALLKAGGLNGKRGKR
jgi:hypothetical protein